MDAVWTSIFHSVTKENDSLLATTSLAVCELDRKYDGLEQKMLCNTFGQILFASIRFYTLHSLILANWDKNYTLLKL